MKRLCVWLSRTKVSYSVAAGIIFCSSLLIPLVPPAVAQFNTFLSYGSSGSSGPPVTYVIGAASNPDALTTPLTISSVNTPAGALIVCVAGGVYGSGATWSATDTVLNNYHEILYQKMTINDVGLLFYSYNSTAMTGGTISINSTSHNAANQIRATCKYATGIQTASDPHDATVDATAAPASATSASITGANAPAVAGSLQIGYVVAYGNSAATLTGSGSPWGAFTGLTSPGSGVVAIVAGDQVSSSKLTYSATWSGSNTDFSVGITAFKP